MHTGCILNDSNRRRTAALVQSINFPRIQTFREAAPHLVGSSVDINVCLPCVALDKLDPTAFEYVQQTNNCVGIGGWIHSDAARAAEIIIKGEPEGYYKRTAHEPIYGYRGERADAGMEPSLASEWLHDYGMVPREKIGDIDLSEDRTDLSVAWGRNGPPQAIKDAAKKHPLSYIALCESAEDLADGLSNCYFAHSGGMDSFSQTRDSQGFGKPTREGWSHDMPHFGFSRGSRPGFVFWPWGDWIGGPQHPDYPLPTGCFFVDWSIMDQRIKEYQSCWLGGQAAGWPAQSLVSLGEGAWL
jgi:hypothetical protein